MRIKINHLNKQLNENNADFIVQQLKKEYEQLHDLVNKKLEDVSRKSDDLITKKVNNNYE